MENQLQQTRTLVDDLLSNVELMSEEDWNTVLHRYRSLLSNAEFRVLRNRAEGMVEEHPLSIIAVDAQERVESQYGVNSQQAQVIMTSVLGLTLRSSLHTHEIEELTDSLQSYIPAVQET